ncbi:MAG: hypothetical protein KHX15_09220, partial [Streptococcus mitis]|nr:hypothetical protein [Streptococcus mitis]
GDKEDSGDKNENEDNKDENGNLPNTGSPLGAGVLKSKSMNHLNVFTWWMLSKKLLVSISGKT